MEDDEFNFHRIVKSEKEVAQPALKEVFETVWDKKYPETPWAGDASSVKQFEQKEEEHFQNYLDGLPKKEKGRKKDKRNRWQRTFQDDNWKNYEWDINKYAYALVDSKLFKLDQTDENGATVSEHIVKIKDIRNKTAHVGAPACDNAHFETALKSIGDHIKAFELVQINVSPYLEHLQRIQFQEKPVSSQAFYEMRTQYENLKFSEKLYIERDLRFSQQEKYIAEKDHHHTELETLKNEIEFQKQKRDDQKCKYSAKFKKLKSKTESQKRNLKSQKSTIKRLEAENILQKRIIELHTGHSVEIERLKYDVEKLKERKDDQQRKYSAENILHKQITDDQKCHNPSPERFNIVNEVHKRETQTDDQKCDYPYQFQPSTTENVLHDQITLTDDQKSKYPIESKRSKSENELNKLIPDALKSKYSSRLQRSKSENVLHKLVTDNQKCESPPESERSNTENALHNHILTDDLKCMYHFDSGRSKSESELQKETTDDLKGKYSSKLKKSRSDNELPNQMTDDQKSKYSLEL